MPRITTVPPPSRPLAKRCANPLAETATMAIAATVIGLVYAVLVDRAKFEKFAKALIFLPMAISLVGASLIWKFVYDYRASENDQIGLANQILKWLGFDTYRFLLNEPWNTFFLIVIIAFLLGRRSGKFRSTLVEIRRD